MVVMNKFDTSANLLDPDHLRAFLAVARFGNVTKASEYLGRTQSAISVQIKHLESDLRISLFTRNARGVTLTHAGERLVPQAQTIIEDLRKVRALFAEPLVGTVRVGIPDDYGASVLQTILKLFSITHPRVEISVQCAFSTRFPDLLRSGSLDLAAFVAEPAEKPGDLLIEEPMVWAAHKSWSRGEDPVRLALFDRECWWRDVAITALNAADIPYRIILSSESMLGIRAAIVSGLAVGVLARGTVDQKEMRILDRRDGFPDLPKSRLYLDRAPDVSSDAIDAMGTAIRQGFQGQNFRSE